MQNIEDFVTTYIANAIAHNKATEDGDWKRANQAHDNLVEAYRMLCKSEHDGLNALLALMEHEDAGVRCWAATHCLELDAPRAEKTLRELAEGSYFVSFGAEIVLAEWKKGTLEIPK